MGCGEALSTSGAFVGGLHIVRIHERTRRLADHAREMPALKHTRMKSMFFSASFGTHLSLRVCKLHARV